MSSWGYETRSEMRRTLTLDESVSLSPWEKWSLHGRFPFKPTLQFLLALTTLLSVVVLPREHRRYVQGTASTLRALFNAGKVELRSYAGAVDDGGGAVDDTISDHRPGGRVLFTVDDLSRSVEGAVWRYVDLPATSLGSYNIYAPKSPAPGNNLARDEEFAAAAVIG